jgi:hypothetical protein
MCLINFIYLMMKIGKKNVNAIQKNYMKNNTVLHIVQKIWVPLQLFCYSMIILNFISYYIKYDHYM